MTKDCFDKPCRIDLILVGMATPVSWARLVGGNRTLLITTN